MAAVGEKSKMMECSLFHTGPIHAWENWVLKI